MREQGLFSSYYITYSNYLDIMGPYDELFTSIGILGRNKEYANSVKGLHGDGASKVFPF